MAIDVESCAKAAVDCGLGIHRRYGPGLLETAYEAMLAHGLTARGFAVKRQVPISMEFEGGVIDRAFVIDLLVEKVLAIEVKSIERIGQTHVQQLTTYLRLANLPLGLLMNFGAPTFKQGLRRVSNDYQGDWRSTPS